MEQEILQYFNHPLVQRTYNHYNSIWERDTSYPYLNYFGINKMDGKIVSVKFYFHVFSSIQTKDLKQFLPRTDEFDAYQDLYEPSKVCSPDFTGMAFEVKFKANLKEPVQGFHFKAAPSKETYDRIGYPKLIPFDVTKLPTKPGINFEYEDSEVLRKQYYYFTAPEHKSYFSDRFNYSFLNQAAFVEYTESNKFAKFNLWVPPGTAPETFNTFTDKEKLEINRICNKYGFKNHVFGFYENQPIKSVYFIDDSNNDHPKKDSSGFYRNTLAGFLDL